MSHISFFAVLNLVTIGFLVEPLLSPTGKPAPQERHDSYGRFSASSNEPVPAACARQMGPSSRCGGSVWFASSLGALTSAVRKAGRMGEPFGPLSYLTPVLFDQKHKMGSPSGPFSNRESRWDKSRRLPLESPRPWQSRQAAARHNHSEPHVLIPSFLSSASPPNSVGLFQEAFSTVFPLNFTNMMSSAPPTKWKVPASGAVTFPL